MVSSWLIKTFVCQCGSVFAKKANLLQHQHESCKQQNRSSLLKDICKCGATFHRKSDFCRHELFSCKLSKKPKPAQSICKCGQQFSLASNLKRHLKKCRGVAGGRKCYLIGCTASFHHEINLVRHLLKKHSVDAGIKHMSFDSMDKFIAWKCEEERSKFLFFSQQAGGQLVSDNIKYTYFICQRDGTERLGNTQNRNTSMRHKKGKVKVGFHCPARILVREDCISKHVQVQFISTHTHKVSFEDVRHHPISHVTQESIKQKLSLGIPAKLVHQSLTETFGKRGRDL